MKSTTRALIALLIMLAALVQTPARAAATSVVPGEILVRLRAGISPAPGSERLAFADSNPRITLNRQLAAIGADSATAINAAQNIYRVTIDPEMNPVAAAEALMHDPAVVYAEPNHRRVIQRTPNDTIIGQQWSLQNIQAFEAWDITTGSDIVVAVLDTGIDASHVDLNGKALGGFNAFT
ncbi:MAG: peptidase S8, partial [Oscillochloris sp.]|nr:peptidase S8 [Oscillochloris sp.]